MAAIGGGGRPGPRRGDPYLRRLFQGVEHRIELVRTLGGVRYYNDSIASSPSRTIAGLRCFPEKVILIAGGYDKHIPFDTLGPEIVAHVKKLFLTGATAEKIRAAVEAAPNYAPGRPEIAQIDDFQDAVMAAHWAAEPGDVVLLSPAGAAFDSSRTSWSGARLLSALSTNSSNEEVNCLNLLQTLEALCGGKRPLRL